MVEVICFDFDGVILESVDVKTRAFAAMFERYGPEVRERVVRYHLLHGGVSRFEKIQHFHSEFLGRPISEDELQAECRRFSGLVLEEVTASPFVPGAEEFIRGGCAGRRAFVVSGTPEEELVRIVKARGLDCCFEGVYGAPRMKAEILLRLMESRGFVPKNTLFVGDSITDYDAAAEAGIPFLGRVPPETESPFPPGTATAPDLSGLERFLGTQVC